MTPEQQKLAAQLSKDFLEDERKYAKDVLKLYEQFATTLKPGVSMTSIFKSRTLIDTFVKSVMMYQVKQLRKDHPNHDPEQREVEAYCSGIILGLFLSETGMASLITREK